MLLLATKCNFTFYIPKKLLKQINQGKTKNTFRFKEDMKLSRNLTLCPSYCVSLIFIYKTRKGKEQVPIL